MPLLILIAHNSCLTNNVRTPMQFSIIVPVYNSQENLIELINQISLALKTFEHEIILVNDCSTDDSWSVISELTKKFDTVVGVCLRINSGQDNAILAGVTLATGEFVVIMDDDLQHSPKDIIVLYNHCLLNEADICYAKFKHKKQALWKNIGSWLNGKISEWVIGKPRDIYLSPFKIMRKAIAKEILKYHGPYPYIDGLILSITRNLTQVEVPHHSRFKGSGNFNLHKSISVVLKHVTTFSVAPLRLSSFLGVIFAVSGFLLVPYYLYEYFFSAHKVEGWTSLVVLELILGGIILLFLGLIGEYLGRIYLNINHKPQYVVKEILNRKS